MVSPASVIPYRLRAPRSDENAASRLQPPNQRSFATGNAEMLRRETIGKIHGRADIFRHQDHTVGR